MSESIYTKYNIDKSKLKRIYTNGIPRGEIMPYEDLYYLYIELNLTSDDVVKFYKSSHSTIARCLSHYGITKSTQQRLSNTSKTVQQKYGKSYFAQTNLDKERRKEQTLQKYGVESYFMTDEFKAKAEHTITEKYGCKYFAQTQDFLSKQYQTKDNNKTWNYSKPEEQIYQTLISKWKDVKRQYKSEKYPFNCDFYIPEINTYIEYQGYWVHGSHPYNSNNLEDIALVNKWTSRNGHQYKKAVYTWTVRDVLKRNTAKKNNLNYLEFFSIMEFNKWFDNV